MRRLFLVPCMLFCCCVADNLSAASYELNLEELLPEQTLFKSLTIEADNLQAEIILKNGERYDSASSNGWPAVSEMAQLTLDGPEVRLHLTTQEGNEWVRTINSFHLQLLNEIRDDRREIGLDFRGNPLPLSLNDDPSGQETLFKFSHYLVKTLLLDSQGDLHLNLLASSNTLDLADSAMSIDFGLDKQTLHYEMQDLGEHKTGSWKIKSRLLGKGALVDLLIAAMHKMCETSQQITPENAYEEMVQNFFSQVDYLLQITAPLCDWKGVDLITCGDFDYQSIDSEDIAIQLNNSFQVATPNGDWSSEIALRSYFAKGREVPTQWCQEIIVSNPSEDLEKISQWIQANCLDQLATLLNMPSITYYGNYFPSYFIQALNTLLTSLGEPQADGTLLISVSNSAGNSPKIGDIDPRELGQLLVNIIKEKVGGWWGA